MFAAFVLSYLAVIPTVQGAAPDANSAQEQQADDIVVTAPENIGTRRNQLRKMADVVLREPRRGRPTARYFQQLCPEIRGLSDEAAKLVLAQMKQYGREVGVGFRHRESCSPNALLAFIPSTEGQADTWLTSQSRSLRHLLSYQRAEVIAERGPVRAWNVSQMRDVDGRPLFNGNGRRVEDMIEQKFANFVRLESRLTHNITNEITDSTVLIELEAIDGKTIEQLAAYALMRIAVGVRLPSDSQPSAAMTILTLFDDDDLAAEGLTDFDRALLAKLYAIPANAEKQRLLGSIAARALANEMDTADLGREDPSE